jgi:hypothetical protein
VATALSCAEAEVTGQLNNSGDPGDGGTARIVVDGLQGIPDPPDRMVVDPFAGSCARSSIRAERVPLDIVVLVDASGSMIENTASGLTKWGAVRSALASFLTSSEASGLGVGLSFFPLVNEAAPASCTSDGACGVHGPCNRVKVCAGSARLVRCDSNADCQGGETCQFLGQCSVSDDYCAPAGLHCGALNDICEPVPGSCAAREICTAPSYVKPAVDVLLLPGAANTLLAAFDKRMPDGLTPTGPALQGAIDFARQRALARPDRRVAVLLATDGFPTACSPQSILDIATVARTSAAASPQIRTFVIGVFAADEAAAARANLGDLAVAGGTETAAVVETGQDVKSAFAKALEDVRQAALACEYEIPDAKFGEIDFAQFNVRFLGSNNRSTTVGHVADAAACHPTKGGWYYDADPVLQRPKLVQVCPATCNFFRKDPRGRVDLIVGCKTIDVE